MERVRKERGREKVRVRKGERGGEGQRMRVEGIKAVEDERRRSEGRSRAERKSRGL